MPLRLEIQRKLSNRSARVKAVDFHPTEPWLLTALYTGIVHIWNYETQVLVKSFEASDLPLRASKFIARKSWLITGSDDMLLKVFNYNTHEKVASFEGHSDYIRGIAVHASQPLVLTCSDDLSIKMWDWEKGWKNILVFEGHTHFVMHVTFNPKDPNTFASASMDKTIKVWNVGSPVANYTLEGHAKGVNCVEYYEGGDKPYLVSSADDRLIKVWDYQTKTCVQTLEGHSNNVMRVCYHPSLPIIISGSEDGTIRIWHANTYRLENTLNYGMERVWCMATLAGSNDVAFGYDEGIISIKLGREEPSVSMENTGKIVWAKHNEIQTANIQQVDHLDTLGDGDKLILPLKDLGSCEIYPQTLVHSPNGRFVVVCGDGEFIIYTALAWRNKSFGQALEFVWAQDSNEYAIRESTSKVKLFRSFKEKTNVNIRTPYSAEGIFGGNLLGVKSNSFLVFYDWETGAIVRRIDATVVNVYWSETDYVAITGPDSFYILKFNREALNAHLERGTEVGDEGYEDVLEFVAEIPESVTTGAWAGDCFIYTNSQNRLNYLVGGQTSTVSHFDKPMYLLGFIPRDNRVYVCDKHLNVSSYSLPLCVIEYQTAILRGDFDHAAGLLDSIPADHRNRIARFLETRGHKAQALSVTSDPEHRFELAMGLGELGIAFEIATELDHEHKWKALGDAALNAWNYGLSVECWKRAGDLESILLMYQASGNSEGLQELAHLAGKKGENNIAFISNFLLGNVLQCIDLLIDTGRIPEAAFFARTYAPSHTNRVVALWKQTLVKAGKTKIAESIADPLGYINLFEDFSLGLEVEEALNSQRAKGLPAADAYTAYKAFDAVDIVAEMKNGKSIDTIFSNISRIPSRSQTPAGINSRSQSPVGRPSRSQSPVLHNNAAAASVGLGLGKSSPVVAPNGHAADGAKSRSGSQSPVRNANAVAATAPALHTNTHSQSPPRSVVSNGNGSPVAGGAKFLGSQTSSSPIRGQSPAAKPISAPTPAPFIANPIPTSNYTNPYATKAPHEAESEFGEGASTNDDSGSMRSMLVNPSVGGSIIEKMQQDFSSNDQQGDDLFGSQPNGEDVAVTEELNDQELDDLLL